jgi:hypothetical protein
MEPKKDFELDSKKPEDVECVEFTSAINCYVYTTWITAGKRIIARNRHDGLWAISLPSRGLVDFISLTAESVNKLAGCVIIEEAQDATL